MIVIDTNVISEAIKPEPHPLVLAWFNAQDAETLFLSSHSVAELLFGVGALSEGKRKAMLSLRIEKLLDQFAGRILPFDIQAARRYAGLAVHAKSTGKGFPSPDGYIAAIAATHGFAVASRDTTAFDAANLRVINPWAMPN